tara:strand:+ start:147852 stop:150347 length:2496 start_codon:yes stop_codon:yes gene_type:complete
MSVSAFSQVYERVCPSKQIEDDLIARCLEATNGEQGTGRESYDELSKQLNPFFQVGCWEEVPPELDDFFGDGFEPQASETNSSQKIMERCQCQASSGLSFCKSREQFYEDLNIIKKPIKKKASLGIAVLLKDIVFRNFTDEEEMFCGNESAEQFFKQAGCSEAQIAEVNENIKSNHLGNCNTESLDGSTLSNEPTLAFCGPPSGIKGFEDRFKKAMIPNDNFISAPVLSLSEIEKNILAINRDDMTSLTFENFNQNITNLNDDLVFNFKMSLSSDEKLKSFFTSSLGLTEEELENSFDNLKNNFFLISQYNQGDLKLPKEKVDLLNKIKIRLKATPELQSHFFVSSNEQDFPKQSFMATRKIHDIQRLAQKLGDEASTDEMNREYNKIQTGRKCNQLADIAQVYCNKEFNFFNFINNAENETPNDQFHNFLDIKKNQETEQALNHLSCVIIKNQRESFQKMDASPYDDSPSLNVFDYRTEEYNSPSAREIETAKKIARELDHYEQVLRRDSSPESQQRVFAKLKEMKWPEFMGSNPFRGSMTVDDAIFKARDNMRDWIVAEADSIESDFNSGQAQKKADAIKRLKDFKAAGMEPLAQKLDRQIENAQYNGYVKRAKARPENDQYKSRGGKTQGDQVRWQPSWSTNSPRPVAGPDAAPTGNPQYEAFNMIPREEDRPPKDSDSNKTGSASKNGSSAGSGNSRGIASVSGSSSAPAGVAGAQALNRDPNAPVVLSSDEAVGEEFENKLKTKDKVFVYDYKEDIVFIYEKDAKNGEPAELTKRIPRAKIEKAPEEFPQELFRIFKRYRVKRLNHLLSKNIDQNNKELFILNQTS